MNILFVGMNYAPESTGSGPYNSGLAEILVEKGHSVEALVGIPHYPAWKVRPSDRFIFRRTIEENGVLVRRFRLFVPAKQTTIRRIVWEFSFLFNVITISLKTKPKLVIACTPSLSGGILGVYFAKKFNIPLITIVQDLVGLGISKSGLSQNKFLTKIVSKIENSIFKKSTKVAIVSQNFCNSLMEANILQSKTFYLPNWTHIKSATVTRERARFNLDWPSNAFIILHSGNMGLKQNLENVIETAKLFRREENFRFVLCGDGSQKKTLINLAKGVDTISFLESVDEMEYPNLLLAADVLLINERSSVGNMSLPSKLTSYLAAGRPVLAAVSSDGACASELQRTGGAGVIVPAENPADLARAIRFLRDNPEKIQKMSNLALKYSQEYLLKSKAESTISSLLDSIKMTKK